MRSDGVRTASLDCVLVINITGFTEDGLVMSVPECQLFEKN